MMVRSVATLTLAVCALTAGVLSARADPDASTASPAPDDTGSDKIWAVHGQATDVLQYHPAFNSPYEGKNSLTGAAETSNNVNASLLAGVQPWKGGQFWFDLDLNQGFAPSNTEGVAGYVNGEGAKVGHRSPYYRPQRLFFRQTIALGGGDASVDPGQFDFGGKTTRNRVVITVGKFSLTDVVDDNTYAHDPQNDFLNWAIIDTGSFDYAADAWGFSYGGIAEWYQGDWTLRGGVMALSLVPNQAELTPAFRQFQPVVELERLRQEMAGPRGQDQAADVRHGREDGKLRGRHCAWRSDRTDAGHRARAPLRYPFRDIAEHRATRHRQHRRLSARRLGPGASTSRTNTPTSIGRSPSAARSPAQNGAARTIPSRWPWWSTASPGNMRRTSPPAALASWSATDGCRIRAPKRSSRPTTASRWSRAFTSPSMARGPSQEPGL